MIVETAASPSRLVASLVNTGSIKVGDVVSGAVTVHSLEHRNTVHLIATPTATISVKVHRHTEDRAREMRAYTRLRGTLAGTTMPTLVEPTAMSGALTTSTAPGLVPVSSGHSGVSLATARALGRAAAVLHGVPIERSDPAPAPHWLTELAGPLPAAFAIEAPAVQALISDIQADRVLTSALAPLAAVPTTPAWVHGDLKLANCLKPSGRSGSHVVLLDWEMTCVSSPATDVGALVGSLLEWSITLTGGPMRARRAIAALLDSYRRASSGRGPTLREVVAHAGVRLLQSAYERCSGLAEVPPLAAAMVRSARACLTQPVAVAAHVLGESIDCRRTS